MSKRILVVEDQEDLRGVLRDLLTGSGYLVLEAAASESLPSLPRAVPPIIIMSRVGRRW